MTVAFALFSFIISSKWYESMDYGFITFSVTLLLFLPDSPTRASWATEQEKVMFVERVRANNQGLKHKTFKTEQAIEAAKDPYTYLLFFMAFFNTLIVGGINTFSNLLINQAFGFGVRCLILAKSSELILPLGPSVSAPLHSPGRHDCLDVFLDRVSSSFKVDLFTEVMLSAILLQRRDRLSLSWSAFVFPTLSGPSSSSLLRLHPRQRAG
jgi:hypothetical protein